MKWIYQGHLSKKITIQLFDNEYIGSIDLSFLENLEYINYKVYNLLPDECPFNFTNTVYGYNLKVLKQHQNKGYGKKIIQESENYLKKSCINFFFLDRETNNEKLNKFYKKTEFKDILVSPEYILFYKSIYK